LKTILPKLVAYRAIMNIRNIHQRKYNEFKKIKAKAELNKIKEQDIVKEPRHMNDEEKKVWMTQQIAASEATGKILTEEQLLIDLEEADRKEYGRFWIMEGYFSDK
jgi:uncharacterized membrane protein YebE (DUF533 family)